MRSSSQILKAALKLAKDGDSTKSLALVEALDSDALAVDDLRSLALVYSFCGHEHDAERIWQRICLNSLVAVGDWYMLGTTQLVLGHNAGAIASLRQELMLADSRADLRYQAVASIHLAYLLVVDGAKKEALQVLDRLSDKESTYVHGVGLVTKRDLVASARDGVWQPISAAARGQIPS